jgi:hypothetical protein
MKRLAALVIAVFAAGAMAQSPLMPKENRGFEDEEPWQELKEVEPPAFPKPEDLREYYVGPATANKYFIDASTLSVGSDRIVRYVLVVRTAGGATNVSFEGIDCKERAWKHYASGRSDGTWVKSQPGRSEWRPMDNYAVNRHHAALSKDYFCPAGLAINTAEEGRNALRLGMHPNSTSRTFSP